MNASRLVITAVAVASVTVAGLALAQSVNPTNSQAGNQANNQQGVNTTRQPMATPGSSSPVVNPTNSQAGNQANNQQGTNPGASTFPSDSSGRMNNATQTGRAGTMDAGRSADMPQSAGNTGMDGTTMPRVRAARADRN